MNINYSYMDDDGSLFDAAEATLNMAKTLRGLEALHDDYLEILYRAAKQERRARGLEATVEEGFANKYPTGNLKSLSRYPNGNVTIRYDLDSTSYEKTFSSMQMLTNFLNEK